MQSVEDVKFFVVFKVYFGDSFVFVVEVIGGVVNFKLFDFFYVLNQVRIVVNSEKCVVVGNEFGYVDVEEELVGGDWGEGMVVEFQGLDVVLVKLVVLYDGQQ